MILLSFCLYFLLLLSGCNLQVNHSSVADTSTSETENTLISTQHVFHTVEDTIKFQLGGKLFYPDFNPEDSITVIDKTYYKNADGFLYREYHFIIHNTYTPGHSIFQTERINEQYKKEIYEQDFNHALSRQDSLQIKEISPGIENYKGYWIYVTYLEEYKDYFLYEYMGLLANFCLTDSLFLRLHMDGVYPYRILNFEVDSEGGFSIELPHAVDLTVEKTDYQLIDKEREIYGNPTGSIFITPAYNANKFKIVYSVNNTGDLI